MAINVDLVADASKAIKEAGKLGDALEDIADDLEDVGKTGKTIDDKVGDAFKSMEADAKAAGKSIDDKVGDALRGAAKDAQKAGKSIGDDVRRGTDRAGQGFEELRDESAGSAREAAASFSSIEDSADVLQEVLANAFAGFGPAGMAAGILAAAGIGLLFSSAQDSAEKVNENKENMLALAQTIRDNGGVLTEADYVGQMEAYGYAIQDTKEFWEVFQADAVSGFDKLKKMSTEAGLSLKDLYKGGFGDKAQAQETLDAVIKKLDNLREKKDAVYQTTGALVDPVDDTTITSLEEAERLIRDNISAQEAAAVVEATRKDSIAGTSQALREEAQAQEAAADNEKDLARYVQGTAEQFRDQADAIEEATDALKGSITSELDYLDAQAGLTSKLQESGNAWDINTAKGRENQRAVVDMASGIEDMARASLDAGKPVADVTAKFQAQKDALVNQVLPAFQGNKAAAQAYIDTILKTPPVAKTRVELDKEEAERRLRELQSPRGIPMTIYPDGSAVEKYFQSQQGRKIFVEYAPKGGGQAAALP